VTKEKIEGKIERELQKISSLSRMLKGTINKVKVKSRDTNGNPKVVYQLTYKDEGNVTKTIYVKKGRLAEAEKMTGNFRKAKECLERIIKLNEELFKIESKNIPSP
jgi:hypothetical protein